jgi:hypothetical protein
METESGDFDILRNKELIEKENKFYELVSTIEKNHKEYFEKRPPKYVNEEHDKLRNHYTYLQYSNTAAIEFKENTDLADNIKTEVENAFKKVFGQ